MSQPPQEKKNKYILLCDYCATKIIIREGDQIDELTEVPTSRVPGGAPVWDKENKKIVSKKPFDRTKIFKCKCGRGVRAKKLQVSDSVHEMPRKDRNEKEDNNDGCETGSP